MYNRLEKYIGNLKEVKKESTHHLFSIDCMYKMQNFKLQDFVSFAADQYSINLHVQKQVLMIKDGIKQLHDDIDMLAEVDMLIGTIQQKALRTLHYLFQITLQLFKWSVSNWNICYMISLKQ